MEGPVTTRYRHKPARSRLAQIALLALCLLATLLASSCSKPPSANESGAQESKRNHLTGRVISVDKAGKSVMIDGDEIPGFMSAMQMPYTVKDLGLLDKLTAGDQIAADIVVRGEE